MVLEDFFTLTEMKDGLSTLARVEELILEMQKQRDCILNNVTDAARQWSAVAGTLAATENKDCLNHFVQLNGLCFLNQWLQEAQKCIEDVNDDVLEGSIATLLATLDKLPIDREKLIISGIGVTVEHLVGHKNLNIKEKVRILSGKWSNMRINDVSCHILDNRGTSVTDQPNPSADASTVEDTVHPVEPVLGITPGKRGNGEASCEADSVGVESQHSNITRSSDSSQVHTAKDVKISASDQTIPTNSSNSAGADAALGEMNSLGSSLVSNSCPENFSVTEESSVYPVEGLASAGICTSPACRVRDVDDQQDGSVFKVSDCAEGVGVEEDTKECSKKDPCNVSSSSGLSGSLPSGLVEDSKVSKEIDIAITSGSSQAEGTKVNGQMEQNSELGLEYEEVDALEMARQVALEVEREVVDYREPFCSSPEVDSGDTLGHSPEGKQGQSVTEELDGNELPTEKDLSDDASSPKEPKLQISENVGTNPKEHEPTLDSPKLTSVHHGSSGKFDKNICDFDLNEDICTEEFDCSANHISVNLSAPVAVVAPSKGPPNLPVTPLQFEGEKGWKGSAATSAFRPASPRRTPDCEKICSSVKQKSNFFEIDLNVAESEQDVAVDPIPVKRMPVSPGLPSGDSSVEVSSIRAERLKLDLNRIGDEDMSMNPSSYWRLHHQNGDQNLSSASSSSSRQPSMRDFDLNDNPCFFDVGGSDNLDKSTSKAMTTYGSSKLNDPGITLMGSRMAVERQDYVNQAHQSFLGNGLNMEAMMAARPGLTYAHMPPPYGYNGHLAGSVMPFSPAFYGHGSIPYMVDSRGATVIPQVLGTGHLAGLNGATSPRPPFIMSVTGATATLGGVGPSRGGLDLNSGMTSIESGSREEGSYKQLFMHGNSGLVEEQTRISLQPSTSGMPLKRKEPDCGWEPYALGYKQCSLISGGASGDLKRSSLT